MTTSLTDNGVQFADGSVLAATVRGALFGCGLSTAGASATMSIAAGQWTDSTNQVTAGLTAIAKTTATWVLGTAGGGLDTGIVANSTWYHYYAIRRPDTGVVDVIFSLSATAPTLPASYTQFRRIGSGRTNASSQWLAFVQDGDVFTWLATVLDVATTNPGTSAVLPTLSVPLGVRTKARILATLIDTSSPNYNVLISDPSANAEMPSNSGNASLFAYAVGVPGIADIEVFTNISSQIRYQLGASAGTTTVYIRTRGWVDTRGRNA